MYKILQYQTQRYEQNARCFLGDLIRIDSLSHHEQSIGIRILNEMKQFRFDKVFMDEIGNVVGVIYGTESEPNVLLNCHIDTVGINNTEVWTYDPHKPMVKNGRMYGLGASDCKAGIASQVYATQILLESMLPLRGNLIVALTVAEENGLSTGVRYLLEKTLPELDLKPTFTILGEPTNLGLYYGHDGWMEVDILLESTGPNSLQNSSETLRRFFPPVISNENTNRTREDVIVNEPTYVNFGDTNQIKMSLEARLHEDDHAEDVLQSIKHNATCAAQACASVESVNVMVHEETFQSNSQQMKTVKYITNAWATDPFSPLIDRVRQSLTAASGSAHCGKWKLDRLGMGTAGSVFVKEFNIPTVGYGPGEEEQAHAANESVNMENIKNAIYGTAAIVHGLIGVPIFGWTSDEI